MLTFTSEDGNQDPTQKTVENGGDIKAVGDGIDCIGGRGISRAWEERDGRLCVGFPARTRKTQLEKSWCL